MTLDRQAITERLAHDYATRARVLNLKFEDAYKRYYDRCSIRSLETLMEQFTCANLDRLLVLLKLAYSILTIIIACCYNIFTSSKLRYYKSI